MALQTMLAELTKAKMFNEPIPGNIHAGLAMIASGKHPLDKVKANLGSVTDGVRASATKVLAL